MIRAPIRCLWAALPFALIALAPAVGADSTWIKGGVELNVRSGPGTRYRILSTVETGDAVTLLARGDGWVQVRTPRGREGWIPAGFLVSEPPPRLRVEQLEARVVELRGRLSRVSAEAEQLRAQRERAQELELRQRADIERLSEENLDLRAGARWPYLITGAGLLAAGMLAGAVLVGRRSRRHAPRIRL